LIRREKQPKPKGINFLDRLSNEDRKLAIENSAKHWQSLTPEQKAERLYLYYAMLRQKQREHGGMITTMDAVNEFFDKDLPAEVQGAIEEAEQNGRFNIAAELRSRRFGVDTFEIILVDEDTGEPIP
jgi:acyl-CoA reductase-like NAD-dependent aldehyde dehydrogenase